MVEDQWWDTLNTEVFFVTAAVTEVMQNAI